MWRPAQGQGLFSTLVLDARDQHLGIIRDFWSEDGFGSSEGGRGEDSNVEKSLGRVGRKKQQQSLSPGGANG